MVASLASTLRDWWAGRGAAAPMPEAPPPVQAPAARQAPRVLRRSFQGAEHNNLTASFNSEQVSLNVSLESRLRTLRARSRHLAKNNDYMKRFLRMVQNHIVGPNGFRLSVPCVRENGSIDDADKLVCEKAFARWAKRGVCDVTGRLSFVQLCRLAALLWARDGEVLIRRVTSSDINTFGYALQVIDPVLLDETYRADFPDGRRIRMGVETNAWGRPVAYHLLQNADSPWGTKRERVEASKIWHLFLQEEPDQVRGVPWIHTAMRRLNDIGGYEEAAIIAARVGASQMGFFIPPAAQTGNLAQLANDQQQNADGTTDLVRDATPGTFDELPPGYDFKTFDPDYPHADFGAFIKAMLRGVASGAGVDYPTLANDLESINFSSIRAGKLETQDEWMCLQSQFDDGLLAPMWPEWLKMAFASGNLAPLPVSKFDKFDCAVWQGRRWPWVDPLKDAQARVLELNNALTSYSQVMRELGRDPDATWRELEKDKERIKNLITKPPPASPAGGSVSGSPKGAPSDDEDA